RATAMPGARAAARLGSAAASRGSPITRHPVERTSILTAVATGERPRSDRETMAHRRSTVLADASRLRIAAVLSSEARPRARAHGLHQPTRREACRLAATAHRTDEGSE